MDSILLLKKNVESQSPEADLDNKTYFNLRCND